MESCVRFVYRRKRELHTFKRVLPLSFHYDRKDRKSTTVIRPPRIGIYKICLVDPAYKIQDSH